jgi:peroxiredoxin
MQCRSHAAQLGRAYEELKNENFELLLILGESLDKARQYVESLHLPYQVLSDPDRAIYHQYGLGRTLTIQRTASIFVDCMGMIQYIKTTTSPMVWLQEHKEVLQFAKTMPMTCG